MGHGVPLSTGDDVLCCWRSSLSPSTCYEVDAQDADEEDHL